MCACVCVRCVGALGGQSSALSVFKSVKLLTYALPSPFLSPAFNHNATTATATTTSTATAATAATASVFSISAVSAVSAVFSTASS